MSLSTIRKLLLATGALIGGVLLFLKSESYARNKGFIDKLNKDQVNYKSPYHSEILGLYYKCEDCQFYQQPDIGNSHSSCKIVKGDIDPNSGCDRWVGFKAYRDLDNLRILKMKELNSGINVDSVITDVF